MKDRFRTIVEIKSNKNFQIGYQDKFMMIGSCFAENIGNRFQRLKFPVLLNPFGIQYNPLSIANSLANILYHKNYTKSDLTEYNNLWHSMDHHGIFSSKSPKTTCEKINKAAKEAMEFLKEAHYIIVTFGTSWVFEWEETGKLVSNCHKIPATHFSRRRLNLEEITSTWIDVIDLLKIVNPNIKVLFTVSPVRHLKDGAHENQLSKANLLLAIDHIRNHFSPEIVHYFPSYEIVLDELRDYRFYNDDMAHISSFGENYIFDRFCSSHMNKSNIELLREIEKVMVAKEHRILTENKEETSKFAQAMLKKIHTIENQHPSIDFKNEKKHFATLTGKK